MDLIGFYSANPAFFEAIFAPTYLFPSPSGTYLLTGLRASCRTFANIIPKPKRAYLRHVCEAAVRERNVELCAMLGSSEHCRVCPGFAAFVIFESASVCEARDDACGDILLNALAQIEAANLLEYVGANPYWFFDDTCHNKRFVRTLFDQNRFRKEMVQTIDRIALCPDPHIIEIIRSLVAQMTAAEIEDMHIVQYAVLNEGTGATELFNSLIDIPPKDFDELLIYVLRNPGPCAPDICAQILERKRPVTSEALCAVASNRGPNALRLFELILAHVDESTVASPEDMNQDWANDHVLAHIAAANPGPCALDIYKRVCERGFSTEVDIICAANGGNVEICQHILAKMTQKEKVAATKRVFNHFIFSGANILGILELFHTIKSSIPNLLARFLQLYPDHLTCNPEVIMRIVQCSDKENLLHIFESYVHSRSFACAFRLLAPQLMKEPRTLKETQFNWDEASLMDMCALAQEFNLLNVEQWSQILNDTIAIVLFRSRVHGITSLLRRTDAIHLAIRCGGIISEDSKRTISHMLTLLNIRI